MVLFLGNHAYAQGPTGPGARTQFVLNVYVDPIYGDDTLAYSQNMHQASGQPPTNPALQTHPSAGTTGAPQGYLIHLPYSFKTINGPQGFLAWFWANFGPTGLPWTNKATGKTVEAVVVHALPGIYAPIIQGTNNYDPKSHLPYNGERFPIPIPDRVGIQGTSALNTIFNARGYEGSQFESSIFTVDTRNLVIGGKENPNHSDWEFSFIDGVTIEGARGQALNTPQGQEVKGAGVVIEGDDQPEFPDYEIWLSVTNCIITNNVIGIAIGDGHNYTTGGSSWRINRPKIINCTIAWNMVGILKAPDLRSSIQGYGVSKPAIINCIFDATSPYTGTGSRSNVRGYKPLIGAMSGFEGLQPRDLIVKQIGSPGTKILQNFNAYEYISPTQKRVNTGGYVPGWPNYQSQALNVSPRVDISMYTGFGNPANRGNLYINDILWNYHNAANNILPSNHDLSPHDFRLTYHVGKTSDGGVDRYSPNPLVDVGLDFCCGNFPIVMQNGTTINYAPGLPLSFADNAVYNCSDTDLEGFGNARSNDCSWYNPSNTWNGMLNYTDLGADELGELIIAGYVAETTILSKSPENRPGAPRPSGFNSFDNTAILFFNYIGPGYTNPTRPNYNLWIGRSISANSSPPYKPYEWWSYVWRVSGYVPPLFFDSQAQVYRNFTTGEGGTLRASFASGGKGPFMRNLMCDISPHLLSDIHPFWAMYPGPWRTRSKPGGTVSTFTDAFSSNPWFDDGGGASGTPWYDNENLYYVKNVYDAIYGILNPPGSWVYNSQGGWLDPWSNQAMLGPFGFNPSPNTNYVLDLTWGIGDTRGPDIVPDTTIFWNQAGYVTGWRFNAQLANPDSSHIWTNLQSFLGLNWVEAGLKGATIPPKVDSIAAPEKPLRKEPWFTPWRPQDLVKKRR